MPLQNDLPGVPLIESPFFDEIVASDYFSPAELEIAQCLSTHGFAILPGFFDDIDERAGRIRADLQPLFDDCKENGDSKTPGVIESRIQDGFRFSEAVREIAAEPRILQLLDKLYGRRAFPFQTLNFEFGSQQPFHSDAVHFHSVPERYMCGIWVALEDVNEDNGPLCYFPGSHKLPVYDNRQVGFDPSEEVSQIVYEQLWHRLVDTHGFEKRLFTPRGGDVLIWTANLLHGGELILKPDATRWSQVTHYFFEGCDYLTPMHSDLIRGNVSRRTPHNILTGKTVNPQEPYRRADQQADGDSSSNSTWRSAMQAVRRWLPAGRTDIPPPDSVSPRTRAVQESAAAEDSFMADLPSDFDPVLYLELNPDVAAVNFDPVRHYRLYGYRENRKYKNA